MFYVNLTTPQAPYLWVTLVSAFLFLLSAQQLVNTSRFRRNPTENNAHTSLEPKFTFAEQKYLPAQGSDFFQIPL